MRASAVRSPAERAGRAAVPSNSQVASFPELSRLVLATAARARCGTGRNRQRTWKIAGSEEGR